MNSRSGGLGATYVSPNQGEEAGPDVVYGVWIAYHPHKQGWLFNEAVGTIFHTRNMGVAFAHMNWFNRLEKDENVTTNVCTIEPDGLPGQMIKFEKREEGNHDENEQ